MFDQKWDMMTTHRWFTWSCTLLEISILIMSLDIKTLWQKMPCISNNSHWPRRTSLNLIILSF